MIYIVEDDENIREMESYALKYSGYEVRGFSCGDELRAALDEMTTLLAGRNVPVYVTLDLDVLDPSDFPQVPS